MPADVAAVPVIQIGKMPVSLAGKFNVIQTPRPRILALQAKALRHPFSNFDLKLIQLLNPTATSRIDRAPWLQRPLLLNRSVGYLLCRNIQVAQIERHMICLAAHIADAQLPQRRKLVFQRDVPLLGGGHLQILLQ